MILKNLTKKLPVQEMSNDTEAMVGSEMLLDCSVTGNPPAEVLWLTPRFVF
jgi:hypothetical protein